MVQDGDPDAALKLVMYYTNAVPDATAAYYWTLQAKKLGHPGISDDHIRDIESMIWKDLSEDVQEGEGFDTLEEAVRNLKKREE
ncbi:MAG: hypothetical protein R3F19_18635 [Verrucomicrobiales bacterium]